MLSKFLLIAIVFLLLLAFLVWVLNKVFPKTVEAPLPPEQDVAKLSEAELLAAKEQLNSKSITLKNKQALAEVKKRLSEIDTALAKFDSSPKSDIPPSVN